MCFFFDSPAVYILISKIMKIMENKEQSVHWFWSAQTFFVMLILTLLILSTCDYIKTMPFLNQNKTYIILNDCSTCIKINVPNIQWSSSICLLASGATGTPGGTGQSPAGEGGSNVVRKRQKTSSDPESDASESELNGNTYIQCLVVLQ